jgi:hypothetical protein
MSSDANGTLRLVLAGKDRMHPGILDGKVIERARPVAGLIFFNDEGDEVGGLTIMLADAAGKPRLTLRVDATGAAAIEFLDADGKVTQRLPQ